VVEAGGAEPFAEAVVAVNLELLGCIWISIAAQVGELVEGGVEGLDAAVERAAVEALDGRI
jgi:hypothetical protein